jgi:hypothetical protein
MLQRSSKIATIDTGKFHFFHSMWTQQLTNIKFNRNQRDRCASGRCPSVSRPLLLITKVVGCVIYPPIRECYRIYASVPGAMSSGGGQFTFPCESMPFVSMVFGGRRFDINPLDSTLYSMINILTRTRKLTVFLVLLVNLVSIVSILTHILRAPNLLPLDRELILTLSDLIQ